MDEAHLGCGRCVILSQLSLNDETLTLNKVLRVIDKKRLNAIQKKNPVALYCIHLLSLDIV